MRESLDARNGRRGDAPPAEFRFITWDNLDEGLEFEP
jgi:hypothetical protein